MTDDVAGADGAAERIEIEDIGSNPAPRDTFAEVVERRMDRRAALRGLFGTAAAALLSERMAGEALAQTAAPATAATVRGTSTLTFRELAHQPVNAARDSVAEGYEIQTLIRWGDPILPGAPEFDPDNVSAESQSVQFGYNNDYLDFFPLPRGSGTADHGLLVVNHEYTNTNLMFSGVGEGAASRLRTNEAQTRAEIAAHGLSVVEIRKTDNRWSYSRDGALNRRITGETPMAVSGPAAGHERLRTNADPTGRRVLGTFNNCAGGNTPWGTVLTTEENFNQYFGGEAAATGAQAASYKRYGIVRDAAYAWGRHVERFSLDHEPNEPNRFGWIVEFDPYDPGSVPVKRTALGRIKHEGCSHAVSADGRAVFYMGDDERNDYVYKFVTARPVDRDNRDNNRDLLDDGTLYVARLLDDGRLQWLPLVFMEGPLTPANHFDSQADVVIEARRAADLLGATPMDRPEDVETNPVNGRVYVILTNNTARAAEQLNAANPRPRNTQGHVIELIPPGAGTDRVDHAATEGRWEVFLLAGQPGKHEGAQYNEGISAEGWLSCPDNCTFDRKGRIWIATDGAPSAAGIADGLYAADTAGPGRALTRTFYQAPAGAEVCGPLLAPDDRTVFLAIQHPGEDRGSTFESPSTRWPDFRDGMPPRPSVIAIVRRDGGEIGT